MSDNTIRALKALYFEDVPGVASRNALHFMAAWEAMHNGIELFLDTRSTFEECTTLLRDGSWDLLIADLLAPSEESAEAEVEIGIELIRVTRASEALGGEKIAILAFSREARLSTPAITAGADAFFLKHDLRGGSPSYEGLQTVFRKVLTARNFDLTPAKSWSLRLQEGDLVAEATMWRVGRKNLETLIDSLVGGKVAAASVASIRSGLSGADILRVLIDFQPSPGRNLGSRKELVLKISKNKEHIEEERRGLLSARDTLPDSMIPSLYSGEGVASAGQHHAIAFSSISSAQTLLDWLVGFSGSGSGSHSVPEIEVVLREIFLGNGLSAVWNRRCPNIELRPSTGIWQILNLQRRASVRLGISDLGELFEKFGTGVWDAKLVENFLLESRRIGDLDEEDVLIGNGLETCISHGDLHGRNILVDQRARGWIIDFGNIGVELPWPADLARVSVDLLLSGLDSGPSSYMWDHFGEWMKIVRSFVAGEELQYKEDARNSGLLFSLTWLRSVPRRSMEAAGQESPEWQLCLAYAVEFLRSIYRLADMPAPKRVLAGLGACIAIKHVETLLRMENST